MTDTPATSIQPTDDLNDAPPSLVGTTLSGRYKIEAELGLGGMGAVYRAEHTLMHKRLAVKVLHPEMTRLPEVVARFEREAMAAAHIEHPNVAAATDFGKLDDGSFFLVLEFVEGVSLREVVCQGPMAPGRAMHVARQMVSALVRAHALGIVHRDLKPENVMLVNRDGDPDFVKVLDFGIAKVPVGEITKGADKQQALTKIGMVYGTPEYMAPEQALGQDVDARADLYAMGVILYEMLTGLRPFESENPVTLLGMQVTQQPPSFAQKAPGVDIPIELEVLVMELLEKEASRRPTDSRQVFDALSQLQGFSSTIDSAERAPSSRMVSGASTVMETAMLGRPATAWLKRPNGASPLQKVMEGAHDGLDELRQWLKNTALLKDSALLGQLRSKLPPAVVKMPPIVWIGAAATLALMLVLMTVLVAVASGGASTAKPAFDENWPPPAVSARTTAPEDALKEAAAKGPEALETLVVRFPNDPAALKLLARTYVARDKAAKAIKTYTHLLSIQPTAVTDEEVVLNIGLLAAHAQAENDAFELMETSMGSQGPDLLYGIAYSGKSRSNKAAARAIRSLQKPEVLERGTAALAIAAEMRAARGCQAKFDLIERARLHGDERTLHQLRAYLSSKGCGFLKLNDCWPCMRRGTVLTDALKAIEERVAKTK